MHFQSPNKNIADYGRKESASHIPTPILRIRAWESSAFCRLIFFAKWTTFEIGVIRKIANFFRPRSHVWNTLAPKIFLQ